MEAAKHKQDSNCPPGHRQMQPAEQKQTLEMLRKGFKKLPSYKKLI